MTIADSSGGWMLLHHATVQDDPVAVFDRFGLMPEGSRLAFGETPVEWLAGPEAAAVAGALAGGSVHLLGIAAAPDLSVGHCLAFRLAGDTARTTKSTLRLCTTVGLVAAAVDADIIGWLPAKLWSSARLFGDAVVATERQGLPPVMHLVAFQSAGEGIATHGLAWFCGHELRLTAPSGYPEREVLRRAARLAIDAMMHDGLAGPMTVAGIDKGEKLVIGRRTNDAPAPTVPVELHPPPG